MRKKSLCPTASSCSSRKLGSFRTRRSCGSTTWSEFAGELARPSELPNELGEERQNTGGGSGRLSPPSGFLGQLNTAVCHWRASGTHANGQGPSFHARWVASDP